MNSKDWTDTSPHPWRRYGARLTDIMLGGTVFWFLFGVIAYGVAPDAADRFFASLDGSGGRLLDLMMTVLISVPISAAFVGATGLSPGKWIFGVRVTRDGQPLGFGAAFNREVSIWIRGLGLGVPIVSLVTLANSFSRLKDKGSTQWDEAGAYVVTHRPESSGWSVAMWATIVALIVMRIGLNAL